ncbi:MAG: zinc ribbon domain-containing protein [Acidobacteria bacterium]|nr:zinc ribbon domain-containing protein [Acidobacteriota bacterium]
MPLYEYECDSCGHRFEVIQKFSDAPLDTCPKCGKGVHKLMASPAIQFKGSGWYITDYAKKDSTSATKAAPAKEGSTSSESASAAGTSSDSSSTKSE